MPPEPPKPPQETGLVIHRWSGLVTLPHGGSPPLSEIINRSLAHIQTSKALGVSERRPGEECDFEIAPGVMIRTCWVPPGEFPIERQLVTTCNQLKMPAADGKHYLTSAAKAETLLGLVQSVSSPKTEPIKLWLASVGYECMLALSHPSRSLDQTPRRWVGKIIPVRRPAPRQLIIPVKDNSLLNHTHPNLHSIAIGKPEPIFFDHRLIL